MWSTNCHGNSPEKFTLQWRHNGHGGVSNHQPCDCLLYSLFRRRWKKTSKLRVTGLCEGNSPVTGEFPAQRTSNAENVSIWWRHHDLEVRNVNVMTWIAKGNEPLSNFKAIESLSLISRNFRRICGRTSAFIHQALGRLMVKYRGPREIEY